MNINQNNTRAVKTEYLLSLLFYLTYLGLTSLWAYLAPLGDGPDETLRYLIPYYIYQHGTLPLGTDLETIAASTYGISYAFFPYLSAIVQAGVMKIVSLFGADSFTLLYAGRMVSVFFGLLTAIIIRKTARLLFRDNRISWLFTLLCVMWPEVLFLNTYINSDSLALLSCAVILYALVYGQQNDWNRRSCLILAIGFSLCALSYYNAYGMILSAILIVVLYCLHKRDGKELLRIAATVFAACFVLCGWWFIRNGIAYHGDFLGISTNFRQADHYGLARYRPSSRVSLSASGAPWYCLLVPALSDQWFSKVRQSYIAAFGHSQIILNNASYFFYRLILLTTPIGLVAAAVSAFRKKLSRAFFCGMLCAVTIPFLLCYLYSYFSDYQPQGRYLMPGHFALVFFCSYGIFTLISWLQKLLPRRVITFLCILLAVLILIIALESLYVVFQSYAPALPATHQLQFKGGPL